MNHILQIVAFGFCCYFRSIFVPRSCSLNPYFTFSKSLTLSFIDTATARTKSLALFIRNITLLVCVCRTWSVGGFAAGLAGTSGSLDILESMQSSNHEKSSSPKIIQIF